MTDYRSFVKSKLAVLDRQLEEIGKERDRLMATLGVLDEADSEAMRSTLAIPASRPSAATVTIIDAIAGHLKSSGRMMTGGEIYNCLKQEREVSRASVYTALNRLKKRGRIRKEGKAWGLEVRNDSAAITNPTEQ